MAVLTREQIPALLERGVRVKGKTSMRKMATATKGKKKAAKSKKKAASTGMSMSIHNKMMKGNGY